MLPKHVTWNGLLHEAIYLFLFFRLKTYKRRESIQQIKRNYSMLLYIYNFYSSIMHTFNDIEFDTEHNKKYNSSVRIGVSYKNDQKYK